MIILCSRAIFGQSADPVLLRADNKEIRQSEFEYFCKCQSVDKLQTLSETLLDSFIDHWLKIAEAEAFCLDTAAVFSMQLLNYQEKSEEAFETYLEVNDAVEADFQNYVLNLWLSDLRKKSKVEINQEVLKTVNNHRKN